MRIPASRLSVTYACKRVAACAVVDQDHLSGGVVGVEDLGPYGGVGHWQAVGGYRGGDRTGSPTTPWSRWTATATTTPLPGDSCTRVVTA